MNLPHRRQFLHLTAGAAALPALPRAAWAQAYPSRPVRWDRGLYARRLEYAFETATSTAGTSETLSASEYYQGSTDWYVFDRATTPNAGGTAATEVATVKTFIPARVEFDGMPDTRFWAFEDGKTNFGNIGPSTAFTIYFSIVLHGMDNRVLCHQSRQNRCFGQ